MADKIKWVVHHEDKDGNPFATRVEAENGEAALAAVLGANKGHVAEHAYGDNAFTDPKTGDVTHMGREVQEFGADPKPKAEPEPQDPATVQVK